MAQYSRATLTDAGVVIARRMMDDDSLHLTFTGIASGDGQYSTGEDLAAKTALKSQKQFFPLSSKKVTSDQVVQLKYVLSNINPDSTPLTVGYYVREVGIFAQVGSEAAVLYAIAVADENTADYMPEYNELQPSTITMDWFLTVANTENISIAASTTAYALASDLAETNDEVATKLTAQGGDASGTIITTVTASTAEYPVPAAGDSMSTVVGKVVKFFGDIVKTFTGATSSAAGKKGLVPAPSAGQQTAYMRGDGQWTQPQNNATTTQNGYVLDAKMGKTLQDQITSLNDSLSLAIAVRPLTVQQAVDVAPGDNVVVSFTKPTVAGYETLLFIYSSANTATLVATQNQCSFFYSDTRDVSFRNVHSARYTATVSFVAFVLLVKQELYGGIQ